MFREEEISRAEDAFDLLSRVKSTDQAEMIAAILFSYDGIAKNAQPTEQQVYDHVMNRKPRWRGVKDLEVKSTICDLSTLAWMMPRQDVGLLDEDNLF